MNQNSWTLGQKTELKARKFFEEKGYQVLFQNYWIRKGKYFRRELDLVLISPDQLLVFCEVRLNARGWGLDSMAGKKNHRWNQAIEAFLHREGRAIGLHRFRGIRKDVWIERNENLEPKHLQLI